MAALAGQHQRLRRGAGQQGHAQAGAGAEQGAHAVGLRRAGLQDAQLLGAQQRQTVGLGGEVVEQLHPAQAEAAGQRVGVQHPGQVGQAQPLAVERPGQGEAGRQRPFAGKQEGLQQAGEVGMLATGQGLLAHGLPAVAVAAAQQQACAGTADVGRQEEHGHLVVQGR
ncbi:hypothetical protein D3C78_1397720 [compost metagenome]